MTNLFHRKAQEGDREGIKHLEFTENPSMLGRQRVVSKIDRGDDVSFKGCRTSLGETFLG